MERLSLRGVLPEKGDFVTFRAVRELHEMLSFNEEEIEKFNLKQEKDQITWDADADTPREFPFSKTQTKVITDALKSLNDKGEIDASTFGLYEKFIEQE
jgi:hypothetical protein